MIHQHIWASPKPGMTEQQFQDYWLNYHAVNFAAKIPQILAYSLSVGKNEALILSCWTLNIITTSGFTDLIASSSKK